MGTDLRSTLPGFTLDPLANFNNEVPNSFYLNPCRESEVIKINKLSKFRIKHQASIQSQISFIKKLNLF